MVLVREMGFRWTQTASWIESVNQQNELGNREKHHQHMKTILSVILLAVPLAAIAQTSSDTGTLTPTPVLIGNTKSSKANVDFLPELTAVTTQIKAQFDSGATNASDLNHSLQAVNDLIVKHIGDGNRDQVARLYLLDAHIYADGLKDTAKARAIWGQVARDFPGTVEARGAAISLAKLNAAVAAEADPNVSEGLEVGQKFPGFSEVDLTGNPLSVAAYRGRVTMIDFWATWCPPCRGEMPNVISTYNRYHTQGFDIIGVSLDEDKDAVVNFTRMQGMGWAQYFDGQGWDNKLAKQYGIRSIPMDYLLDGHGVIIGKELRGDNLMVAVAKAIANNH